VGRVICPHVTDTKKILYIVQNVTPGFQKYKIGNTFFYPVGVVVCDDNDNESPVIKSFDVEERRAKEIVQNIENALINNRSILEILQEIFDDDKLTNKERVFSIYAAGFVGGRHTALNEIADIVGVERFAYFMDEEKNQDDCMYQ